MHVNVEQGRRMAEGGGPHQYCPDLQVKIEIKKGICHEMNTFLRLIIINRYFLYMR
jgi:hypothetical protein